MIDLMRFCANQSDHREYLRQPWLEGDWVYATNAHVCVRVPPELSIPCEPGTSKHPKPSLMFAQFGRDEGEYRQLPKLPLLLACGACHGKGILNVRRCPDCTDGTFQHGQHWYDCQNCEGEPVDAGWIATPQSTDTKMACFHCAGRGAQSGPVYVGDKTIAELIYLTWLSKLPGLVYRTNGGMNAIHFKFDGGEALLMQRTR